MLPQIGSGALFTRQTEGQPWIASRRGGAEENRKTSVDLAATQWVNARSMGAAQAFEGGLFGRPRKAVSDRVRVALRAPAGASELEDISAAHAEVDDRFGHIAARHAGGGVGIKLCE